MYSNIREKEHQLLLDAIKEHAIFMIDKEGYIISWNDGAQRLKGFTADEVLGKHYRILFAPEDQQQGRPERAMRSALEKGKFTEDWWRARKDGSRFWAHVSLQPIYDENQQHIGFAKITSDISAQKRLNELNDFLMNEVTGYAIFLLDSEGKIAKWSKAAESIVGYSETEALGRTLALFSINTNSTESEAEAARHLAEANGNRYEEEGWKRHKDGRQFWANYVLSPVHNSEGYVVLIRDLTEKRAFEQEQLTNKELSALNEQLERFVFVASHDLKEPVRKISVFAHMLQAGTGDQPFIIGKIISACKRVSNLLDNILELSQLTAAQPVLITDLNTLLARALATLDEEIRRKGALVHVSPLPTAPVIPEQFEQLLENLIGNALKFGCVADCRPEIFVESVIVRKESLKPGVLSALKPSEQYLRLKVRDNGIGFRQEYAPAIFDLFGKLHGSGAYEGTGMGLAICKKIAENHGGQIAAFSEPGKGALFVVTLPYYES
ncbi:sensor histidine kinase [Flaviaesturariibacter terrae]